MFLPALLWRDFGPWSFAVFAVPNILGAALMGWVMRSPDASRQFIERHRLACVAFSIVTVAFQVFFAAWVARVMGKMTTSGGWLWHTGWVACVIATLVGAVGGKKWGRIAAGVGAGVWAVSLAVIAWVVISQPNEGVGLEDVLGWSGTRPPAELVPLAMVCILGFMLCPYLDLTFHRARIESAGESKRAFGFGFGLFFALMIVGTLLTTPVLLTLVEGGPRIDRGALLLISILLSLHTLPQLVYTCWVHAAELRGGERTAVMLAALGVGLGLSLVSGGVLMVRHDGLYMTEVVYRCFMGFYGLVAPAYVAIVAWPVRLGGTAVQRSRLSILVAVVVAATWFYWLGFVERQTWWVAIGVAIVVAGKLISRYFDPSLQRRA